MSIPILLSSLHLLPGLPIAYGRPEGLRAYGCPENQDHNLAALSLTPAHSTGPGVPHHPQACEQVV